MEWDRGVTQTLNSTMHRSPGWAVITSITEVEPTDLVYDFAVPGRENFYAGSGIDGTQHLRPADETRRRTGGVELRGAGAPGDPITIFGDGTQNGCSFTYVDDQIRGFLALLDSRITTPVNIGNPDEITIFELAELVLESTGSQLPPCTGRCPVHDPGLRRPDITKAPVELGWEPKIDLRTGLAETIAYFRHQLGP